MAKTARNTRKAIESVTVQYFAGGKLQDMDFHAAAISSDTIKAALSGASTIDEACTFALLSGTPLPITGADFLKQSKAAWIESDRAASEFHKDKIPAYKTVQIAERIRKVHTGELLTAWQSYLTEKQAEYTDKKKAADAEGKKIAALRIQPPTVNGLNKILREPADEVPAMEKAVKFLQKAIESLDSDEKLTKVQQQFHSKLIAALADPEAKKWVK